MNLILVVTKSGHKRPKRKCILSNHEYFKTARNLTTEFFNKLPYNYMAAEGVCMDATADWLDLVDVVVVL